MSVTLRWFPNSWFEIVGSEAVIDIDPALFHSPEPPADLAQADLVLVTHHHPDHCDIRALGKVASAATVVYAPQGCAQVLGDRVQAVLPGGEFDSAGVHVRVVDAYNTADGSSTRKAHEKGECVGYVLTVDGVKIYHAGDTDFIAEMMDLGDIDVALLPVGGTYTMDAEEAARAAVAIQPRLFAIPMHPRDTDVHDFERALEGGGVRVATLQPGVPITLE